MNGCFNMGTVELMLGKAGFSMFTLGLAIGELIPRFRNRRMGLSAHTTGVQAGIALIAFGLFWPQFGIASWAATAIANSLIASFSILILSLMLAASFGASEALPITGEGANCFLSCNRKLCVDASGNHTDMLFPPSIMMGKRQSFYITEASDEHRNYG